jgi:HK97 gp10 family phage protein
MEVKVDVRLNGIEEKLEQLGPKLAKSHLRKALRDAAKIWEIEAKVRAPVDTGALRDSIQTKIRMSPRQDRGSASVGPMMGTAGAVKDSSQDPGVYGKFVELGLKSKQYPMQPFLRPAFDSRSQQVLDKFVDVLREGLTEAAK